MGDTGEAIGTLCFHFDRPSPDVPCPRCGMPAEKEASVALTAREYLRTSFPVPQSLLGRAREPERPPAPVGKVLAQIAEQGRLSISAAREMAEGLVPVGSQPILIGPRCEVEIELWTQLPVLGPYRIGIATASETRSMRLRELRLGNVCLFGGVGEVASEHLEWSDAEWPEGLVPVAGPEWHHGTRLAVRLYNTACFSEEVTVTVWGRSSERDTLRVPSTDAIQIRLSDVVAGCSYELRSQQPEDGQHVTITNTTGAEIRLHEEKRASPSYDAEVFEQYKRRFKHLNARIKQLNDNVERERGRAEGLERQLAEARSESEHYRQMLDHADCERGRMLASRASSPAAIHWFGKSWDAPVCMHDNAAVGVAHVLGKECAWCGRVIEVGYQGFVVSSQHSEPNVFHRQCWYRVIGAPASWPATEGDAAFAARERQRVALEAYYEDARASAAHASRQPVDAADEWGAWQSATDEGP